MPALLALCVLLAAPAAASGQPATCGLSAASFTGLVGADQYGGGVFVRHDYAFDDRGAATGPAIDDYENLVFPGATAARSTRGSYRYPDPGSNNLADMVKVRIDRERVVVTFNALEPGSTVVGIAIDTDLDAATGAGEWPHGAQLTTPGADVVLTGYDGAFGVDYDTATGTITLPLPPTPADGRWRFWIGAGLWDGDGWMEVPPGNIGNSPGPGSLNTYPRIFDLAFNVGETYEGFQDYWNERRQAEALGQGDISEHHAVVDFGRIRRCEAHRPEPPPGAFATFVYPSSLQLGHGMVPEPRRPHDNFVYLSPWQPYTVYVPTTLRDPSPLVWLMHARGMNHNSYPLIDHRLTRIAEELGALLVTPLSRGEYRMCEADAEVDFFETWDSIRDAFDLDDERVYLTGLSMGGICMWRLGLLYPDLFAAGIAVAASPRLGAYPSYSPLPVPYDMTDYVENARHLPILVLHGASDAVLPYTDTDPAVRRMDEMGLEHRVQLYTTRGHDATLTSATARSHVEWLERRTRVVRPPRVTYRMWPREVIHDDPALLNRDHGFAYDRAYWISGIEQSDPAGPSSVDAQVVCVPAPRTERVEGVSEEDAGPFVWFGRQPSRDNTGCAEPPDVLQIGTDNVASLVVDLPGAGMKTNAVNTVTITGAAEITLTGPWASEPDVRPRAARLTSGAVTLASPGTYTISPRVGSIPDRPPTSIPLPATGSNATDLGTTILIAMLLMRAGRRRRQQSPS